MFRSRLNVMIAVTVAIGFTMAASAQSQNAPPQAPPLMAAGLWRVTLQTLSPVPGPPLTHEVCLERALTKTPPLPASRANDDCHALPDPAAANEIAYTVRCQKLNRVTSLRLAYGNDHFDGSISMKTGDVDVRQTYTGQRIGDCDYVPPQIAPPNAQ